MQRLSKFARMAKKEPYELVKRLTGGVKGMTATVVRNAQGTLLTKRDDILKQQTEYVKALCSVSSDTAVVSSFESRHNSENTGH